MITLFCDYIIDELKKEVVEERGGDFEAQSTSLRQVSVQCASFAITMSFILLVNCCMREEPTESGYRLYKLVLLHFQ